MDTKQGHVSLLAILIALIVVILVLSLMLAMVNSVVEQSGSLQAGLISLMQTLAKGE